MHFLADVTPLPAGRSRRGTRRHERVAAGALLAACRATPDGRVRRAVPSSALEPGEWEVEIPIPNPDDRAELVAAIAAGRSTEVDGRFLVYLAGHHPYRDRLFVPAHDEPLPPGPFLETLPPAADRWVYRVRSVDPPVTCRPVRRLLR